MLVMKFGGTSVQDATSLKQVASIVKNHLHEQDGLVVVLSATAGTTDVLLDIARGAGLGRDVSNELEALDTRHTTILAELAPLATHVALRSILEDCKVYTRALSVLGECTSQSLDHMAAFGEQLSTSILHSALEAETVRTAYFDVRQIMRTDDTFCSAIVDMKSTRQLSTQHLLSRCSTGSVVVTQGFIGADGNDRTTTLGRGGSDYTCAILGAVLGAREIRIWTDVSGVFSADPRVVPDAQPITELSFDEVREMALYGAKVLHPDTIAPAIDALIPVQVLNTFKPNEPGTRIVSQSATTSDVHAVSIVRGCSFVRCDSTTAAHLRSLSELSTTIVLETETIETSMFVFHTPTEASYLALEVAVADSSLPMQRVSLIAVTGPAVSSPRVTSAIISTMSSFEVHCLSAGATAHTIFMAVDAQHGNDAVRAIHSIIPRHL
ncbi:MAG: aspartate kinase [Candidatus Kapabacteria bacterium]|nr:aspartate kinase [Candidatus Kapabacteria bacterium]